MRYKLMAFLGVILISATTFAQVLAVPENRQKLTGTAPDASISREVMHQLLMNPYYGVFDNLEYSVDRNHVTLTGQVTDPVVKSDAVAAVRRIRGVESVTDNIEVLPLSTVDNLIRRQVYRAVFGFSNLSRYSWGPVPAIHFIVDNGHITLVGVVDSQGDKDMAGLRANAVPGVFSVTNNLQVESATKGQTQKKGTAA